MKMHEKGMLRRLLVNHSFDEVDNWYRYGTVPQYVYELYCSLWRNCCVRLSSVCSGYDRPWKKLARAAYDESK